MKTPLVFWGFFLARSGRNTNAIKEKVQKDSVLVVGH